MVFQLMFLATCNSSSMAFCASMVSILDTMTGPPHPDDREGWRWYRHEFWCRDSLFFSIRADVVEHLDVDLRRLRWADKLNVARIFTIYPTNPTQIKTIGDKTISQNRWVYDLVTSILSPKRVVVTGRRAYPNAITRALPTLPNVYYISKPHVSPPKFRKMKACRYHQYTDDHPDVSTDDEDV